MAQFKIEGLITPYRYGRNDKGGSLLLFIREYVVSRVLQCKSQCNIESIYKNWFLNYSCNPHRNSISRHLECLNRIIDEHGKTCDNFIFIGDFDVGIDENSMKNFCDINCLKSLIRVPICFKNPGKRTCIDLISTNRPNLFQHCF